MRALLNCSAKYNGFHAGIGRLCAAMHWLGRMPRFNRLETPVRKQPQFVAISNFEDANETDQILWPSLSSTFWSNPSLPPTDTRLIGFLSHHDAGASSESL